MLGWAVCGFVGGGGGGCAVELCIFYALKGAQNALACAPGRRNEEGRVPESGLPFEAGHGGVVGRW